jgi:nucleoside-diphosphate-sugar epimerase
MSTVLSVVRRHSIPAASITCTRIHTSAVCGCICITVKLRMRPTSSASYNTLSVRSRQSLENCLYLGNLDAMPTNLYGPGDNFSLQTSHVLPALLRKIHDAKKRGLSEVEVWGTGKPRREFLHVDDLADACVFLMQNYDGDGWINVGWGRDETIAELAHTICRVVGFTGALRFDTSKPDGTPRKLLDTSRLTALGWSPRIELEAGIRSTYEWFLNNREVVKT